MKNKVFKYFLMMVFCFAIFKNFNENLMATGAGTGTGTDANAITAVLCNVVKLLTGGIAKGVSIVAIVVVAVGLFMGKFSWGVGLATAIGIAMIFGASTVVDWLSTGIGNNSGWTCS